MKEEKDYLAEQIELQKKYLPLLVDASKLVHKFYFETGMELIDVLQIVSALTDNICDNVDELPKD